jgi:two-component system CheB/CheR fusion protein
LAARTKSLFRVECRFRCESPARIGDPSTQTHLFRIAQEAVGNALKHGKPGRIDIRLKETRTKIVLGVRDNGVGFPNPVNARNGLGLRIMQYRAGVIGGALAIRNVLNGGTAVVCSVPKGPTVQRTGSNV